MTSVNKNEGGKKSPYIKIEKGQNNKREKYEIVMT